MENNIIIAKNSRHFFEKQSLKMSSIDFVFHTGSIYEQQILNSSGKLLPGERGYSHLLEHLTCDLYNDMRDILQYNGISYNAYTSDDVIVFTFSGLSSRLTSDIKYTLYQKITGPYNIDEKTFENELKTVKQEYLDTFNDPVSNCLTNTIRKHFNICGPIGLLSDLNSATNDKLKQLHDKYIKFPYSIIEIGPSKTKEFDHIKYAEHFEAQTPMYGNYDSPLEIQDFGKVNIIGFTKNIYDKENAAKINLIGKILSSGLNSPLYQEIREKRGLSYFQYLFENTYGNKGMTFTLSSTSKEKADELFDVYINFFKDIKKYITEDRYNNIMSSIKLDKEKRKILRYLSYDDLLCNGLLYSLEGADKLSYKDILDYADSWFNLDNFIFKKV